MRSSIYTLEQVDAFLEHIQLPQEYRHSPPTLELLCALHTYTISSLPYENLSVHYNPSHRVSIHPQDLFNKIVGAKRGRGGYCMEVSLFYHKMLLALGFDAYTVGARTRRRLTGAPQGDYPGWIHIVNIVTLPDSSRWHVDVAFGGDGATQPMPLIHDRKQINLGLQEIRLIRDWIPAQVHRTEESKNWIYQYRNGVDQEWHSFYAFVEHEFTPNDWEVVNYFASTNAEHSWHPGTVLCIKFLRRAGPDGPQTIYGKRMMANEVVKENLGGKSYILQSCRNESERVQALEKWFGLQLTEEEINGIKGYPSELITEDLSGQAVQKSAQFS